MSDLILQANPFVKVETITKTKLVCPHCGEATNAIDHLLTGQHHSLPYTGKWNCRNEECLHEYEFTIGADKQVKSVVKTDKLPDEIVYDILVLPPQKDPVYLILKTKGYHHSPDDGKFKDQSFYYDEHTCPTNWTRNINCIVTGNDDDPHGLFQFVSRHTLAEVDEHDILDKDNDLTNGGGLDFMNTFHPGHSQYGKVVGMVEEVPGFNMDAIMPRVLPPPKKTKTEIPTVFDYGNRTVEEWTALPEFSLDNIQIEDTLQLVERHALHPDIVEVFKHFYEVIVKAIDSGNPTELAVDVAEICSANGVKSIGRMMTVKSGDVYCGAALVLSEDLKIITAIKLMSKADLQDSRI